VSDDLLQHRQYPAAETYLRECLTIREKKLPDDWVLFYTKSLLGGALAGQKKFQEAEPLLVAGHSGMQDREAKILCCAWVSRSRSPCLRSVMLGVQSTRSHRTCSSASSSQTPPMSAGMSVTQWIGQLKAGEESALERLRQRYWPLLVSLARRKLANVPRLAEDDEDVAQEAFWSFYQSFKNGKLPLFENRQHLLALLTIITARKAATYIEHEGRIKRGGGHVQGESALEHLASSTSNARAIDRVEDPAISPDEEAVARDLYSHYINALPEDLRTIAEQYLANCPKPDIAQAKHCAVRTVERKIELILREWQKLAAEGVNSEE